MFITPAVAGAHVYIGSCAGSFYALDRETGEPVWSHDTAQDGASAQFHGDALITDELVVVGSDARPEAHLYAFERATGAVRWKIPFPFGVTTQVLLHGETVLAVSTAAEVVAVELDTGTVRWLEEGPPEEHGRRPVDPVLADGHLVVGWRGGVIEAFDAATGERRWRRDLESVLGTSLALFEGQVIAGTARGTIVRLEPATGEVLGSFEPGPEGAHLWGDLVAAQECLLTLVAEGGSEEGEGRSGPYRLPCLRPGSADAAWSFHGEAEWRTPRPLVYDGRVLVGSRDHLMAVDAENGRLLWDLWLDGVPRGLGASARTLFVGTVDGEVWAFDWSTPSRQPE